MVNKYCLENLRNYIVSSFNEPEGTEILSIIDSLRYGGIVEDSVGNLGKAGDRVKVIQEDMSEATGLLRWSDDGKEFLVSLDNSKEVLYLGTGWSEIKSFTFIE